MPARIVAVDDESIVLEALEQAILSAEPEAQLEVFSSGVDAIEYARENPIDIAFIDIKMPEPNGMAVAEELQKIRPNVNIIFVTGFANYALDAFKIKASGYVLKPIDPAAIKRELESLRNPLQGGEPRVKVQCFGDFGISVWGEPLHIPRAKPKELLAYLIFENGASVTSAKIASILWENREYDRSLRSQVQTTISQMMHYLRDVGIEDIVIRSWNSISIDTSKISCDYYGFLNGDPEAMRSYAGEFLRDYSWAEVTAAYLSRKADRKLPGAES